MPASFLLRPVLASALVIAAVALARAEDVPYVATPEETVAAMLTTAGVGPGDVVVDLGSGDGRIVISAVKDFGARRGLGIEINPRLVAEARAAAVAAGVADRVEFREESLFDADFGAATVLTMYLLPDLNLRLRPKVLAMKAGTRVVSHEFDMGDWTPDASRTVLGDENPRGPSVVHFWVVPAQVAGTWSWDENGRTSGITLDQRYQRVAARDGAFAAATVALRGDRIRIDVRPRSADAGDTVYEGQVTGATIEGTVTAPGGDPAPWRATRRDS
ncbi:MAG: methyltransferase domain-containing protein [Gemmatimonas sp.]